MILYICAGISIACGLILALFPTLGVKQEKLKPGVTMEQVIKNNKKAGITGIIVGIVLIIVNLI